MPSKILGSRGIALPYLKRLQKASIPINVNKNVVDSNDEDFRFPSLKDHNTSQVSLPEKHNTSQDSLLWLEVVRNFTEKFKEVYINCNNKKRAHLDKFDNNGGVTVIYGTPYIFSIFLYINE